MLRVVAGFVGLLCFARCAEEVVCNGTLPYASPPGCEPDCPDFGEAGNPAGKQGADLRRAVLENLFAHMEMALESHCLGGSGQAWRDGKELSPGSLGLLSCAYHAAGTGLLDDGAFRFIPETLAGGFASVADRAAVASFQRQMEAALRQEWHTHRRGREHGPACGESTLRGFAANRATHMKVKHRDPAVLHAPRPCTHTHTPGGIGRCSKTPGSGISRRIIPRCSTSGTRRMPAR